MKGSLPAARQAQTLNAVVSTLSQCLDLDQGALILELKQAEESRHTNRAAPAGLEEQCLGAHPEEEMDDEEEAKLTKNERVVMADNDFSDLLPVSCKSAPPPYTHTNMSKAVSIDMFEYFQKHIYTLLNLKYP